MREFQLAATLREEGSLAGAMHHLKRALELDADNARAHLLLGYIHLERRNFPVAERHMRHGIDLLQQQENQGTALAEARNVLGAALIEQRRYDEAIAILREAATDILNTAPYYAWGNLGWAYYKKRQYSQALEAFAEATRTQPRFCLGHFRTGQTHFAQQQFALAEQAFTRALEADARCARNQEAWRLRGETRARLGHREDALADFEHCAELGSTTETGSACMRFLGATQ